MYIRHALTIRGFTYNHLGVLFRQVILAQATGVILLSLPSLLLGRTYWAHALASILVVLITAVYFVIVEYDRILRRTMTPTVQRLQRYRSHLGWLVSVDVAIVVGAMGLTGGLTKSHLGFVLLLIPGVVGFVRKGGLTVVAVSIAVCVVVLLELLAASFGMMPLAPSHWLAPALSWVLGWVVPVTAKDAIASETYGLALGFGMIVGILLSAYQSQLSAGLTLPTRTLKEVLLELERSSGLDKPSIITLAKIIARSFHRVSRIVSLTNEPEMHCSVVHPVEEVVFQASVLALPACSPSFRYPVVRAVTEATFCLHWLDDMFDLLGYQDWAVAAGTGEHAFDVSSFRAGDLAKLYSPYGIGRVIRHIRKQRLWDDGVWHEGVETGIIRVFLGGIIQNGPSSAFDAAVERIRNECKAATDDANLRTAIETGNPALFWGMTKTTMPLVLGMLFGGHNVKSMKEMSLLLDLLFEPYLIWHDLGEERRRECRPGSYLLSTRFTSDVGDSVSVITAVLEAAFPRVRVWQGWNQVKPIVRLIDQKYGPDFPDEQPYASFRELVGRMQSSS